MSLSNQQIIQQFYESFQKGDAEKMIACYHPEVVFEDPAFGQLNATEAANMWRMLIERGKGNIDIVFSDVQADEQKGSVHWEAKYPFSKTGRKVHNKIDATFVFQDGKIIKHTDKFDLWKWSSMALGLPGKLLGWSPFMKNKIRQQSRGLLEKYMGK